VRRLFAFLLILPAFAQKPAADTQLDGNECLFTVMAAINAAGYDAEVDSLSNNPLRKAVRDYLATQNIPSLFELKRFVRDHKQADPAADLSQYISYALSVDGPPTFTPRYLNNLMPPDAAQLEGLTPLLIAFYREAHIENLWKRAQPAFDKVIEQYHEPVSRAVLIANAYMRNPTSGFLGRRFQIYIDLLGAPNQVQTRAYVDDYFVVVTASTEPRTQDIRHAYLHYLVDPLGLKYAKQLNEKAPLGDYALGSPLLADHFKKDFILLSTECFIKAVESRIDKKPEMAIQAAKEGFVLTPAFAEILAEYFEKQEVVMRLYFPDLVGHLDFRREEKRLENFQFDTQVSGRTVRVTGEKPMVLTGVDLTLEKAESSYTKRDLKTAKELYLRVLTETSVNSMHAKAYYGLARISVLERHAEQADQLFRKVLELSPDAYTKSWSLLYLARLSDSQPDGREDAEKYYKAALEVEGAPDSVRQAAEKGLKEAFNKK
jgi:tetratricopeptide (TPR) repeat protein